MNAWLIWLISWFVVQILRIIGLESEGEKDSEQQSAASLVSRAWLCSEEVAVSTACLCSSCLFFFALDLDARSIRFWAWVDRAIMRASAVLLRWMPQDLLDGDRRSAGRLLGRLSRSRRSQSPQSTADDLNLPHLPRRPWRVHGLSTARPRASPHQQSC